MSYLFPHCSSLPHPPALPQEFPPLSMPMSPLLLFLCLPLNIYQQIFTSILKGLFQLSVELLSYFVTWKQQPFSVSIIWGDQKSLEESGGWFFCSPWSLLRSVGVFNWWMLAWRVPDGFTESLGSWQRQLEGLAQLGRSIGVLTCVFSSAAVSAQSDLL